MNESCYLYINDKPVTSKMYEMWNNVSSKFEQVQQSQNQTQQPHTSSGSIKGREISNKIKYHMLLGNEANKHLGIHENIIISGKSYFVTKHFLISFAFQINFLST